MRWWKWIARDRNQYGSARLAQAARAVFPESNVVWRGNDITSVYGLAAENAKSWKDADL